MKRLYSIILSAILMAASVGAAAQEDADYRMEIGGGLGAGFYMGDFNNTIFNNQQPAAAVYWRYLFDHYNSLKVNVSYTGIKGSTKDHDSFYPEDPTSSTASPKPLNYSFSAAVVSLNCMYEINFLPYGYYQDFLGHKRLTPYLQLGAGLCYGTKAKGVSLDLPMGIGLKYRVSKRVNLSLDWAMHFTITDKLDGRQDPLGISSEGFKNKDHFGITMLTLTYSFAPRCSTCNKN